MVMWINIFHYNGKGEKVFDIQFEYTKDIKELTYWQNIYQCARKKLPLYHSTIQALHEYFIDKNEVYFNRLGILSANWIYAYPEVTKERKDYE
jgi:hypothetical protein